ncbi:unnamed protein product [Allacma fusca]|uniref:Integrase catalytic domain-containing protein n=1 Tax=Allacma fusca TaxID=39272 RepID=A0A8J2NQI9_9HEXA|nr:unnamed protein product [Allacma fusca]
METYYRKKRTLLIKVKEYKEIVQAFNDQTANIVEIAVLIEKTEKLEKEFEAHHNQVSDKLDDESYEVVAEEYRDGFKTLREVEVELKTWRRKLQARNPASSGNDSGNPSTADVKLPKLDLVTFSGDPFEWLSFHDLFKASIHSKTNISGAQKMQYLVSSLQGEALAMVKAFTVSDENYTEAWELLKRRYHNTRLLVNSVLKKFCDQSSLVEEDGPALRKMIDTSLECTRSLKILMVQVHHWDAMLVYILAEKLDSETRQHWELSLKTDDISSFEDLIKFLEIRSRALSLIGSKSKSTKVNEKGKSTNSNHGSVSKCMSGHSSAKCSNTTNCKKCGKRHHTMLHLDFTSAKGAPAETPKLKESTSVTALNSVDDDSQVLLGTAILLVPDSQGCLKEVRAVLDSGSQATFISSDCLRYLGFQSKRSSLSVTGLGDSNCGNVLGYANIELRSRYDANFSCYVKVFALRTVTKEMPTSTFNKKNWSHLRSLPLADPQFNISRKVDMLLGADVLQLIIQEGVKTARNGPMAQKTAFGWILSGGIQVGPSICTYMVTTDDLVKRFWEIEELPASLHMSPEEKACEECFLSTTTRTDDGRYIVRLPFKSNAVRPLGDSRIQAIFRLRAQERRFQKEPSLFQQYFYLPHHAVLKDSSTTTKCRVVFDGSAKTGSGNSLNDLLMVGPKTQDDIVQLLIRFRTHLVALVGDIEKMYRQVLVHPEDTPYQRILWRENPEEPYRDYELLTVTYGTSCAPYLATRTLNQLAEEEKNRHPIASEVLRKDFYVDDCVSGTSSIPAALHLKSELQELLQRGGFHIRKWASNDPNVISPEGSKDIVSFDFDNQITTLGLQWIPGRDLFTFKVDDMKKKSPTKRNILSEISKIYDPLGWLSPVIVKSKIMLQSLWKIKLDWDEIVPDSAIKEWWGFQSQLKALEKVKIPRCYLNSANQPFEIHGFCDASQAAYAAVVYYRSLEPEVKVTIIAAKNSQPDTHLEERKTVQNLSVIIMDNPVMKRFSNWNLLVRVTGWIFRFYNNFRKRTNLHGPLSTLELNNALCIWVRFVQGNYFSTEIKDLKAGRNLSSKSPLVTLAPFLDQIGVLRVGGRLQAAKISSDRKFPILLPSKNYITEIIVKSEHLRLLHAGPQLLQASISQIFWILRVRDLCKKVCHNCMTCAKVRGKTQNQLMGSLPSLRVNPSRAFLNVGVDFCGPFLMKVLKGRGHKRFKAYVAVFVCFGSRAIHLELVSDLSTNAFMAALRRFTSRRGKPNVIHSDCGTNFVGSNNEMKEFLKLIRSQSHNLEVSRNLSEDGIQWKFNPPGAPHFGGLWEAGVEACLNSRPLCPMSSDPCDLSVLTPGHFLIGDSLMAIPEESITHLPKNRLSRWQLLQHSVQHFWKRWSGEYLTRLQQRPKWWVPKANVLVDSLVLIKDNNLPPLKWKLARVTEIHPGRDGHVRVVSLKTSDGIIQRPISKLSLLPMESPSETDEEINDA